MKHSLKSAEHAVKQLHSYSSSEVKFQEQKLPTSSIVFGTMSPPRTLRHATTSRLPHHTKPSIGYSHTFSNLSPFSRRALPPTRLNSRRTYVLGRNPTPGQSPLRIWPFVLITLAGTASYALMVRSRAGIPCQPTPLATNPLIYSI